MSLSVSSTVADIKAGLDALDPTATEDQRWTAVVTALYNRIKADMVVTGVVSATGADPQGGTVTSTGTSVAGGGSGSIA